MKLVTSGSSQAPERVPTPSLVCLCICSDLIHEYFTALPAGCPLVVFHSSFQHQHALTLDLHPDSEYSKRKQNSKYIPS